MNDALQQAAAAPDNTAPKRRVAFGGADLGARKGFRLPKSRDWLRLPSAVPAPGFVLAVDSRAARRQFARAQRKLEQLA